MRLGRLAGCRAMGKEQKWAAIEGKYPLVGYCLVRNDHEENRCQRVALAERFPSGCGFLLDWWRRLSAVALFSKE